MASASTLGGGSLRQPTRGKAGGRPVCTGAVGLAAALLAAGYLAGCGTSTSTLDSVRVERAIADSILSEHSLYATVSCPSSVPQEKGHVFTCQAHLDVGTYPIRVTETNAAGHVRYENRRPLAVLDSAKVQNAIRASILHQRDLASTVRCPSEVLQKAGLSFTCRATVSGRSYSFAVHETDGRGNVRYTAQ